VGKIHPCKCTTPAHATRPRAEVKPNILVDLPAEDEDAMMQLKYEKANKKQETQQTEFKQRFCSPFPD